MVNSESNNSGTRLTQKWQTIHLQCLKLTYFMLCEWCVEGTLAFCDIGGFVMENSVSDTKKAIADMAQQARIGKTEEENTDKLQETRWQDMSNKHLLALEEEYIIPGTGVKSSEDSACETVHNEGHISGF
jgi:hypothetical protein